MESLKIKDHVGCQLYEDLKEIAKTEIDWSMLLKNDEEELGIHVQGLVRNRKKAEAKYGVIADRPDLKLVEGDVCAGMDACGHADFVIHAASQATPYYFENDPVGTIEANTQGTTPVLRYAMKEQL